MELLLLFSQKLMSNIRAVIFDFDGVILDSVECKTRAFARLFEPWGAEAVQHMVEYHLANGGISRFEKIRYFYAKVLQQPLPDEEFARLAEAFRAFAFDEVVAAQWIPGAPEFLATWHEHYLFFVASGTPGDELHEIVRLRGLEQYFVETHGSPEVKERIIQSVLARYQLDSTNVVFVGDAMTDYRAAKATGLSFIGVGSLLPAVFPPGTVVIPDLRSLGDAIAKLQRNGAPA